METVARASYQYSHVGPSLRGPWYLRAIRLPDGGAPEDWWIVDGQLRDTPVPAAQELPGSWFLPGGLVDAHAHSTMNFNNFAYADGSAELIAANLAAQRAAGVLAIRDAGLAWGGKYGAKPADGPHVQSAGRLLAAPGRGYPDICRWVPTDQLVEAALDEVRGGAAWVKIMADFPGPDGNWFAAPPSYPYETVQALVDAVHAAGARVMAHSTGCAAGDLVRAGVDSIEHGMQLNSELLAQMAQRRTAWVLTLGTALKHVGPLAAQDSPVGAYIRAELARVRELLPQAASLGVPLLVGTDELPHGALAQEISIIHSYGLTSRQALAAASTDAREFLRLPACAPGASADLVLFEADPLMDLSALSSPSAVVFDGRRVK
jgi:imidazolonepropionase-like amidohydrolase